jgi:hypothetical protein
MGRVLDFPTPPPPPEPDKRLACYGVARDAGAPKAVTVIFSRALTDAELRFFHDVCRRSAPLMDGVTDDA